MAFTRTWNAAYEAVPADTDDASEGAQRIRHLKADISERLDVDHSWEGDGDDGKHKQITLLEQAAAPTNDTDTGFLYTKDVSGATELFYEDDSGNEVQLTDGGEINKSFPANTRMLFYQAAAPTYWTQVTSVNDRMLRVVSGSGGGSGGSWTISGLSSPNHTHGFSVPEHYHSSPIAVSGAQNILYSPGSPPFGYGSRTFSYERRDQSSSSGPGNVTAQRTSGIEGASSGTTNNTAVTINSNGSWRPAYIDVIIAEKD